MKKIYSERCEKANVILGYQCVYCPSNASTCITVKGLSESECTSSYACELPNGTVIYGLSADDCRYSMNRFFEMEISTQKYKMKRYLNVVCSLEKQHNRALWSVFVTVVNQPHRQVVSVSPLLLHNLSAQHMGSNTTLLLIGLQTVCVCYLQ